MLKDQDRIFTNIYGMQARTLDGAGRWTAPRSAAIGTAPPASSRRAATGSSTR